MYTKHDEFIYRGLQCYCWKKSTGSGWAYYWTVNMGSYPVYKTGDFVRPADAFSNLTMWADRVLDTVLEMVTSKVNTM